MEGKIQCRYPSIHFLVSILRRAVLCGYGDESSFQNPMYAGCRYIQRKDLRKRQETLSIDDDVLEIADKKGINVQWEQKEILQLIHDMNEPVREVMYLRLISNLSFAEIGEIIGKTENWTRVTFFRGKQKIVKEILKDE